MKKITLTISLLLFVCYAVAQSYESAYNEAYRLYENGRYSEAFQKMYYVASAGYAPAQVLLSGFYYQGIGVKPDMEQAVYWVKKAAAQGDVDGCCELGTYYLEGLIVEKNYALGKRYLLYAANNGSAHAMYLLGVVAGEEKEDFATQVEWFRKAVAANPNHLEAAFNLGYLYTQVNMYKEAYELFMRGAKSGYSKSQYQIALMYCFGPEEMGAEWPVHKNLNTAKYWAEKASEQGHVKASMLVIDINNGKYGKI